MKLNELLNTCQNQWKNVFSRNKDFKVSLFSLDGVSAELSSNYFNDVEYILYSGRIVSYWEFLGNDILIVCLERLK